MAIFIVSPAGGDINQDTTYVGGIEPSDSDIIGFNSSSGNLNVINTSIICTSENLAGVLGVTFRCNSGTAIINLKENAFMKLIRVNILNINASNKTLRILKNNTITTSTNCFKIDSNINAYSTTR